MQYIKLELEGSTLCMEWN